MLIKKTLLYLPSQVLGPLSQLLAIVLWTYFCSKETIGFLTLVTTQQELARAVFVTWWSHYLLRYVNDEKFNKADILSTNCFYMLLSSLLQVFFSLGFIYYVLGGDVDFAICLVTILFVVLRSFNQHNLSLAVSNDLTLIFNLLSLIGPVLGLIIGIVLLNLFGDDFVYPVLGFAVAEFISFCLLIFFNRNRRFNFKLNNLVLKDAILFGSPFILAGAFSWLALNIPRYFIEFKLGLGAVGEFSVGFGLGLRAASMASMLVTSAGLPLAIKKMQTEGFSSAMVQLSNNFSLLILVMCPALFGVLAISDKLVQLTIAEEYVSTTLSVLPWALLSGGVSAVISHYLYHYFFIISKTLYIVAFDFLLASFTFILCLYLVDVMGVEGGVISMALSYLTIFFVLLLYLLVKTKFTFPFVNFLKIFTSSFFMYMAVVIFGDKLIISYLSVMFDIFLGVFVYLFFMSIFFYRKIHAYYFSRYIS